MPPDASTLTAIDEFFERCKTTLLETWKERGFGHIEIDSERVNQITLPITQNPQPPQ